MTSDADVLDTIVTEWLTLEEAAQQLAVKVAHIRRLIVDRHLVAVRRGQPRQDYIPAELVRPDLLNGLAGTVTVLGDCGFDDVAALQWLFTPHEDLGSTPAQALRAGRKKPVRRVAQLLA